MKKVFCSKHELEFVRNIYGDEINRISPNNKTYRSEWKCINCGKVKYKRYLNKTGQTA
ncbi:MAG: hypothetical protein ACOC3V_01470 [bacterium]